MSANYVNIAGGTTYTLTINPSTQSLQNNQFRLICKTADGAITIILPKVSTFGAGIDAKIYVDDIDGMASVNNITVMVDPTDTIANASSFILNQDGEKVVLFISSHTEYGVLTSGGGSGGSAKSTTLLSLIGQVYPLVSNPSENLIANGIGVVDARLYLTLNPDNNLKNISFPDLTAVNGHLDFSNNDTVALETVSFPKLTRVLGSVLFVDDILLTSISFPELTFCVEFVVFGVDILESLDLPKLSTVSSDLVVLGNNLLESINLPLFTNRCNLIQFVGNPLLTSINLPLFEGQETGDGLTFQNLDSLPTISLPSVIGFGGLDVNTNALLTSFSAPLATFCDHFVFSGNILLTTIELPLLTSTSSPSSIDGDDSLVTFSLPVFTAHVGSFTISTNSALTTINLPLLESCGGDISWINNPLLTTINISASLAGSIGMSVEVSGNALTEESVDNILAAIDAGAATGGTLDLTGGTNATPSAAGLVSKANLVGKGWTVTNN